jgi:uncharacterized membrane protein SpoIIM required for sporulation
VIKNLQHQGVKQKNTDQKYGKNLSGHVGSYKGGKSHHAQHGNNHTHDHQINQKCNDSVAQVSQLILQCNILRGFNFDTFHINRESNILTPSMKETRFISQNKEKWLESEALLNEERKDPGKLSDLFVQVVDDLSYSRTHYPNRSVRVYLNKMAREYFSIIYSHQREHKKRFQLFWLEELPQVILHCKIPLLVSLITFLLAISIGIFSSVKDPQFANAILGNEYVEMTKENIAKGDPMAVYKKGHQVDMFLGITLNNLMVAFRTYVFGIFFSIGTLAILLSNGIMVGCFQFFFIERGLFLESALTIWLHGTLEISSIVLAGGAGLTLGSGLIFPGTYSRLQAFQISAMRSLKLMLGITPILILAAIIESFLTRYTEVPDFVRLILILLSGTFIIGYFIVYPWWKSKNGFLNSPSGNTVATNPHQPDIHTEY